MLIPTITIISFAKVELSYPTLNVPSLIMDFNPIIDQFRLRGSFCLLHWQAKPFGQRRWGVFDAGHNQYTSVKHFELDLRIIPRLLQVDENLIKTVPTAVLLFPNSQLIKDGYYSVTSI